jgi:hypothetical protein
MTRLQTIKTLLLSTALIFCGQAQADLILNAGDADYSGAGFTPFNLDADWLESLVGTDPELFLLYKDESGEGGEEEGSWALEYTTTYGGGEDLTDLWIEYDGGYLNTGALWLVVKDGQSNDPAWYVFDISSWDGLMDIHVEGLFAGGGSISNVQIFGPESSVPEPGTLLLLGMGLLGIGARSRMKAIA